MLTTIPPNWKPARVRPMITLKPAHLRPHPVACAICGEHAGSFLLSDTRRPYATCYACASRRAVGRNRFRDLKTGRFYRWPDAVVFEAQACLIAIAHLDAAQ